MRRITTGTADADLFGTGKPGYVDGNAGTATPPTRLNADAFNNLQEEIARAVEGDGASVVASGDTANYFQLDDAVQHGGDACFPRAAASSVVVEGLDFTNISGLDVELHAGRFLFEGRKYNITAAKLVAAYPALDYRFQLTFGGTATNGDYESTFTGGGLSSPVTVTTTRAAGTPTDNTALATQHATDITALIATTLAGVVVSASSIGPLVLVRIPGGLASLALTHDAPSPGTLESELATIVYSLTDDMDTYFFLAPEDPSSPSDPPDRSTVHVELEEVATGAAAPSTPTGTFLFAMVAAAAGSAGAEQERNRGPIVTTSNNRGVRIKPITSTAAAVVPRGTTSSPDVDLGEAVPEGEVAPHNGGHFRDLYIERIKLRTASAADQSAVYTDEYTFQQNVGAGSTADVSILDPADFPEGASFYICAKGAAIDPSDATDGYSFRIEAHVHIDGAAFTLDGSGGAPSFQDGNGAIAAGVTVNFAIPTDDLVLRLTGHGTDATRWTVKVEIVGTGDA